MYAHVVSAWHEFWQADGSRKPRNIRMRVQERDPTLADVSKAWCGTYSTDDAIFIGFAKRGIGRKPKTRNPHYIVLLIIIISIM